MSHALEKIGFGGGCHWCTEAVFMSLRGVAQVQQGFIQSLPPNECFSEAVVLHYDADQIALKILIEAHLRTHASTSEHSMRGKYRSAVYVFDQLQTDTSTDILNALQQGFDKPLITRVLQTVEFKASDERFRNYYATDPSRPFCTTYIDPKLDLLRKRFSDYSK